MKAKYITPTVTLFSQDETIDMEAMKRHFDYLIEGGIDGILLLGSIGEFFGIPLEQKKILIEEGVRYINHRVQVLVGTTSMEIEETIALSRFAKEAGADSVIVLPPYYFTISPDRIESWFDRVASELADVDLYLYNFPDRTGYTIPVDVILNLCRKHPNIRGIKDTQAGMAHSIAIIKKVLPEFPDFEVFAGFDDNFAHNVLSGGSGCIAGLSNVYPEICSGWVKAARENDLAKLEETQKTINGLMEVYAVGTPFIPYIKAAMQVNGQGNSCACTFPFTEANEDEKNQLKEILNHWVG